MSKKDYIKIASVFEHQLYSVLGDDKYNERMTLYRSMNLMAEMLGNDNPRFDRVTPAL